MLSVACAINYLLAKISSNKQNISKEGEHPFRISRYREETFPQSAQFLDFQWMPKGLPGQHRNVMSGLKPLRKECLIHVDPKCFASEVKLKEVLFDENARYRKSMTAGLDSRIDAQMELLHLVLDNLKEFHEQYFDVTEESIVLKLAGKKFRLGNIRRISMLQN